MSFLTSVTSPLRIVLPGLLSAAVLCHPSAARSDDYLAVSRPIPDVVVRALDSRMDIRLPRAIAGRPAVILLTGAGGTEKCPVSAKAAELQREYGPWLSWIAVLSGPFSAPEVASLRDTAPLRLERLYHDRPGAVQSALDIPRLPALLLVDEDGSLHEVCTADAGAQRFGQLAEKLRTVAAAARSRRAGFADFRLPQVGGAGLVSFLDVAGRVGTIVSFIHSNCLPCARQLEVLDFARDRHAGEATFVTVFLDSSPDSRIRGFIAAAGVTPDFVLRDQELHLAGRFGIETVPTMLVVDPEGRIALSRSGYREEDRDLLYRDVDAALKSGAQSAAGPGLSEARRIHAEACAFLREGRPEFALLYQERIHEMLPAYVSVHLRIAEAAIAAGNRDLAVRSLARYLAANPQTYDSAKVREAIASLLEPGP